MSELCILKVEDDAQGIFLQQQAFQQEGITQAVQVVTEGQQAIDYLAGKAPFGDRQRYPVPGLVLLKLKLPRQPGLEVLQWIRAQPSLRALVVIVLDAWEHSSDLERAYELGANSCARQPLDAAGWQEFARALKTWWLVQHQYAPSRPALWRRAGAAIQASR